MLSIIEQFSATSKANSEARLAMFNTLSQVAFDSATKLVELNLSAAKASLAESTVLTQQLLSAKDPQEFFSLTAAHARPIGEKALSYGRHVASVATATQAEFNKATQATITETHGNLTALVDEVLKKAPAGAERAVSLVKSAISHANAGVGLLAKGSQQAVEVLDEHLTTAANQGSQAAETSPKSAARK